MKRLLFTPPAGRRWRLSGGLAVSAFALTVACCGLLGCNKNRGASCVVPAPRSWTAPAAPVWSQSSLFVETRLSTAALRAAVERAVPVVLASESARDVGAPGRASFVVKRGTPELRVTGQSLELRVPISATIDVCKPLGPICVGYGHCEPAFAARFEMSTALGEDYRVPHPHGHLDVTERCVIAVDVTPEIKHAADRELAKVERQIARQLSDVPRYVELALDALQVPLELPDGSCQALTPSEALYLAPRQTGTELSAGVGLRGSAEPSCARRAKPASLPPLRTLSAVPDDAVLWFPGLIDGPAYVEHLQAHLPGAIDGGVEIQSVQASLFAEGVRLELSLGGAGCKQLRGLGQLRIDAAQQSLELVFEAEAGALNEDQARAVAEALRERSRYSLQALFEQRAAVERRMLERAQELLAQLDQVPLELLPAASKLTGPRARITASGIAIELPSSGHWTLTLR